VTAYLIRRFLQALIVVWIVSVITFILLKMLPGGPEMAIAGQHPSPQALEAAKLELGLEHPVWYQYWTWLKDICSGDLGFSYSLNQSVTSLLLNRLPQSLLLVGSSTILSLLIAIPVGVLQAVRRNKAIDYLLTTISFILYSMPIFMVAIILINVFSIDLPWFPPEGPQSLSDIHSLVLPVVSLALIQIALFSRYARSSVLEQITQDYVRTARAKGASEVRILFRHVLRNALIPVVTLLGLSLPGLVAGALVTESVFNYPGMGYLFLQAANTEDYSTLLGTTILVAVATVLGSLFADLGYAALDPRVRLGSS
jgi:peptide/nickel transport system permease protein